MLGTFSQPLQAQDSPEKPSGAGILYGVRLGLLAHDVGGLWSHSRAEGGADVNAELVFGKPGLRLLSGAILPNLGVSINSQGGTSKAYGGLLWEFLLENGLFAYGSYRDPHIVNTLKVYNDASAFITSGDYSEENINESTLQICADIDRPDTPGPAALKSFYRKLIHLTDDMRQNFKTRLLSINRGQVLSTAEKYFGGNKNAASVAVISNEGALKEANSHLKDKALRLYRI